MFVGHQGHYRTSHRMLVRGAVLAVLAGVAACTPWDEDAPPVRTTVEKAWTAPGIDPVSSVDNIGGVAIVYGTTPDGMLIYGLEPATGAVLWSRPAVPTIGVDEVWVSEIEGTVAYFRPTDRVRVARLVLADPRTGEDLTVSSARYWHHPPSVCSDDAKAVCLISYIQSVTGSWRIQGFRVDRATGETRPDNLIRPADIQPADQDLYHPMVGGALFWDYRDDAHNISRRTGGTQSWTRPLSELFGATTTGWSTYTYSESNDGSLAVLTLTGAADESPGKPFDMATGIVSAALTLDDGSSRWIGAGTALGCLGDHTPLDWRRDPEPDAPWAFRCRYTGTALRSLSALDGSQFVTNDLAVILERFDPATGDVMWASQLGDARTLAADTSEGAAEAVLDDTHLFVPNSAGGLLVDLPTGETRPPTETDVLWCNDTRTFQRPEPYFPADSRQVTTAHRRGVFHPCKADGTDAALPTTALPSSVSAGFDNDVRVVAMTTGVSGFLAPPVPEPDPTSEESAAATPEGGSSADNSTVAAPSTSTGSTAAGVTAVEQAWTTSGFEPLTGVSMVGGTAVLYGTVGSDLFLIGLDPATGTERWRQRASAAGLAATTPIAVTEIDGTIAYLRPGESMNQTTALVLADAASGADRMVTEPRWWTGFPAVCEDDPALLCGWSYASTDNMMSVTATRVERSTGATTVVSDDQAPAEEPYETLQGDVVGVRAAEAETVGVLRDGALLWSTPVADILGGPRSRDTIWMIGNRPGNPPVAYFSADIAREFDTTTGYPALDLATNLVTAAVDAETGRVLWREPGTYTNCRSLLGDIERMSTPGSAYPALRCRYTGRLNSSRPGGRDELTVATDLSVTLERVDLSTGRAIWSLPLGAQASLAVDSPGLAMIHLDDHRMLLGGQVVDVDSGAVRAPTPDAVFWCPGRQTFDQSVAAYDRSGSRFDRRAGGVAYPCDSGGTPSSNMPVAVPLAVSAVTDDGLRLVSNPSGVVAYRVPLQE